MIIPVTPAQAVAFIKKHHYSHTAYAGETRYGWGDQDGSLIGVSIYGNGTHAMRQGLFGQEYYRHVMHHHRLALLPAAPKLTASQFCGAALRQLRRDRPDIWAIVTYADACQGHIGTIYQATNAIYTGVKAKGNLKFVDADGGIQTTQSLASVGTWPERRAEAKRRGWREIRCKGKHRYVYLLGTGKQIRRRPPMLWPALPYPSSTELGSVT